MGRMLTNVGALSLEVARAWLEAPAPGLRPLASVLRSSQDEPGPRPRLQDLSVGQALEIEWPEPEGTEAPAAWLLCPVCGVSFEESALRRVGPACSLCPCCGKALPL